MYPGGGGGGGGGGERKKERDTVGDREACAERVKATLLDEGGNSIAERLTDNYGDFKFHDLEENSGHYTIRLEFAGHETKMIGVELKKSVYVGTIFLSGVL